MIVWMEGDKPGMLCSAKALRIFKPHLIFGGRRDDHTEEKAGPNHRKRLKVTQSRETL